MKNIGSIFRWNDRRHRIEKERNGEREMEELRIESKITRVEKRHERTSLVLYLFPFSRSLSPILNWRQQSFNCTVWSSSISQKVKQRIFFVFASCCGGTPIWMCLCNTKYIWIDVWWWYKVQIMCMHVVHIHVYVFDITPCWDTL